MLSGTLPWYVARSAGLMAWVLLSASVLWGLGLSTKVSAGGRRPRPNWMLDLHRYLGGLATIFVAVHVGAIVLDSYTDFGPAQALVPFVASWHPVAVAWGVVGMYLLAAVEVTSLLRRRLPRKVWRITHGLSFPLFITATAHGLSAGTDTRTWFGVTTAAVVVAAIAGLTALRIDQVTASPAARAPHATGPGVAAAPALAGGPPLAAAPPFAPGPPVAAAPFPAAPPIVDAGPPFAAAPPFAVANPPVAAGPPFVAAGPPVAARPPTSPAHRS